MLARATIHPNTDCLSAGDDDHYLACMSTRSDPDINGSYRQEYDGRFVALPRIDLLEPGDILLTSNQVSDDRKGLKQSDAIRRATRGRFSHALICSSPPVFVEAIGSGVSTLSLARCFAHNVANVRLLRFPDREIAQRAAKLAQYEIGRDYSVARAVHSVFPLGILDRVDDHGIFCSALVAQVFAAAGATSFERVPVDRTTPATLDGIEGLEDLTAAVFRPGLMPNNAESMTALDGDRAPTLSAKQTQISAHCARALWPQVSDLIAIYPEVALSAQPTFYSILKMVTEAIERANGVAAYRRPDYDRSVHELDRALAAFVAKGELAALFEEIARADDDMIMRTMAESFKAQPDIDLEALHGYVIAGRRQLADRRDAIGQWERWGAQRSAALALYLPIERLVADATARRDAALQEILERNGRPLKASSPPL
jgi:hypothetical protein